MFLLALSLLAADAELMRTAIVVSDVERSKAFYERLGFRREQEMAGPRNPESPFPLAGNSKAFRLLVMASAGGAGGRIGLLEFRDEQPRATRPADRSKIGLGDLVFVVGVADARAVHRELLSAKIAVVEPPQMFVSKSGATQGKQGWLFHLFDPDGNLIEIYEAPK